MIDIIHSLNYFTRDRYSDARYASYDYCFNYFKSFEDKAKLANIKNLQSSCNHLAFYLASWGMLRGSSFLLQKSIRHYVPLIKWISSTDAEDLWEIDVNRYNNKSVQNVLINAYECIGNQIQSNSIILITKIMLGVFGCSPAFDTYFCSTFRNHFGNKSKFYQFKPGALLDIYEFYISHYDVIDMYSNEIKTFDFISGLNTDYCYTKAKIIDMIGFAYSYEIAQQKKNQNTKKSNIALFKNNIN